MGFWKELGVTALEKGKNLFRGGKQAVEGAKHVEGIVKDAKVSIPATTKPTSYRAWRNPFHHLVLPLPLIRARQDGKLR